MKKRKLWSLKTQFSYVDLYKIMVDVDRTYLDCLQEKAIKSAEKQEIAECEGIKPKADPVFFISLVGTDREGTVDDHEHIFDIYTSIHTFMRSHIYIHVYSHM